MVFEYLKKLLTEQYACDPQEIELPMPLDDLNITDSDRVDLALLLSEHYGVDIPDDRLSEFETVEDMVAYVEDRL